MLELLAEAETRSVEAHRVLAFPEQVLAQQQCPSRSLSHSLRPRQQKDGDCNREQRMLEQLLPVVCQDDLDDIGKGAAVCCTQSSARQEQHTEASSSGENARPPLAGPNEPMLPPPDIGVRTLLAMHDTTLPPSPRKRSKLCLGGPVKPLAKHALRRRVDDSCS